MEGSAFYVLKFPKPWPPLVEFTLLSGLHNEATVTLIVCCDGHLRLTVVNDNETPSIYHATQPINILGSGWAILSLCWNDEDAQIYINGNQLRTCIEAPFEILSIETKDREESIDTTYSFEHPDAISSCQGQMKSRKNLITSPTSDRRARPIDEQLNDLKNSIESLCNFTAAVYAGNLQSVKFLAGELRALLCRGKGYNPLLLRIAALYRLPLPIFAFPKDKTQPDILKQANYHYKPGTFGIRRTLPGQKLMDLEEWLDTYLLIERPNTSNSNHKAKQKTEKRIREIIADAANTLGIAHYDDSIPVSLDKLREFKVGEADLLVSFLAEASSLIISVGKYVIEKASEVGQIDQ